MKILAWIGGIVVAIVVISAVISLGSDTESDAPSVTPVPAQPETKKSKGVDNSSKPVGYPDGDYVVGQDIPVGTYESKGASPGIFDFCTIATEGDGNNNWGQLKSANENERVIITLKESDGVLSISGCEPLTPR
jgi:hypothetical protein